MTQECHESQNGRCADSRDASRFGAVGYTIREEIPGMPHHVGTRGNNRRPIFGDPGSRVMFLVAARDIARRTGGTMVAYCLMTNHYHFVIRSVEFGMARGMQSLNGGYAIAFNTETAGAITCSDAVTGVANSRTRTTCSTTCRYIELNPVSEAAVQRARGLGLEQQPRSDRHRPSQLPFTPRTRSGASSTAAPNRHGRLRPVREGGPSRDTSGVRHRGSRSPTSRP